MSGTVSPQTFCRPIFESLEPRLLLSADVAGLTQLNYNLLYDLNCDLLYDLNPEHEADKAHVNLVRSRLESIGPATTGQGPATTHDLHDHDPADYAELVENAEPERWQQDLPSLAIAQLTVALTDQATLPDTIVFDNDEWHFDWSIRLDRDGKPAGIYQQTPYPITETTTSYTITNDDGTTTYHLGAKYYVDGGYTGADSDGTWARPWTSIDSALDNVSAGNKTIIVRGPHDDFNGEYDEYALYMKTGLDDSHRFMVVGYAQERPIVKGCHIPNPYALSTFKWPYGTTTAYTTLQRFRIQDNFGNGIRSCGDDSYINVIDVWLYNNCKFDEVTQDQYADGNLYFLGSDHCMIRHCTSERGGGHAYKIGDGADYPVVEWSVAKEWGYWEGCPMESYWAHPSGFDFPNDSSSHVSRGIKMRYNIAETGLFYAVQIRTHGWGGHDIKYNEISGSTHFSDIANCDVHSIGRHQVILYTTGSMDFHNNIVRDPGDADASGIYVGGTSGNIRIYNNIIYNHQQNLRIRTATGEVLVQNNSLYADNNDTLVFSTIGDKLLLQNNVLYQAGTGTCVQMIWGGTPGRHDHNRYFFPNGSRGTTLSTGESDGDPHWLSLPIGTYETDDCRLADDLPGTQLTAAFNDDFHGVTRANWDVGACEYVVATAIQGRLYYDANLNHLQDPNDEPDMSGWLVWVDINDDHLWQTNEPYDDTDSLGDYHIRNCDPVLSTLRALNPSSQLPARAWLWTQPDPSGTYTLDLASAHTFTDIDFGLVLVGDATGDRKVDGDDLATWQQNYDPLALNDNSFLLGDWNQDGRIDGTDLGLWQEFYNPIGLNSA